MAKLRVPREQVEMVLVERIRAAEEIVAKADVAERSSGWRDWIFLFERWRDHTIAELRAVYEGDDEAQELAFLTQTATHSSPSAYFPYKQRALDEGLRILRSFLDRLDLAVVPDVVQLRSTRVDEGRVERGTGGGRRPSVFIVHGGSASGFRERVARFVEQVGLNPVILAEQANEGRTLIEKFEAKALDVGYAVVLLTPEDTAFGPGGDPPPAANRARQNVILELGYFMASLGRSHVAALLQEGVEIPTDILGVAYIPLDDGGAWETLLARELEAAGLTGTSR